MSYSIREIIWGLVAPQCRLSCSSILWARGLKELNRRGIGCRESGAFLLGTLNESQRRVTRFVYYDDLEPHCLDSGIVIFEGFGYGHLWQICRESGLAVVADIHTHPGVARQSGSDRTNPMVATEGHVALIVPDFARRVVGPTQLGIYEYEGAHHWLNHSGELANNFFYIGIWG